MNASALKIGWPKEQCGFTLIEMMVTIAVGGILLGIAVSAYGYLRENTRVEAAKEEIVSILQQARVMAIAQGSDQQVSFDHANDSVTDAFGQARSYDNVNIQKFVCGTCTATDVVDSITFRSRGTSASNNVKISSIVSDREFIVMVNSVTGRVDVRTTCVAPNCL